jgi:hypothetical protein
VQHFSSQLHTEAHVHFLKRRRSSPFCGTNPSPVTELAQDSDHFVSRLSPFPVAQPDGDDEVVFNVATNLLPPNFATASFLTPEMVKYHQNEHKLLVSFTMPLHFRKMSHK